MVRKRQKKSNIIRKHFMLVIGRRFCWIFNNSPRNRQVKNANSKSWHRSERRRPFGGFCVWVQKRFPWVESFGQKRRILGIVQRSLFEGLLFYAYYYDFNDPDWAFQTDPTCQEIILGSVYLKKRKLFDILLCFYVFLFICLIVLCFCISLHFRFGTLNYLNKI